MPVMPDHTKIKTGSPGRGLDDLTGRVFGSLRVLSRADNVDGHPAWNAICDCGETIIAPSIRLREGYLKSCGCIKQTLLEQREAGESNIKVRENFGRVDLRHLSVEEKKLRRREQTKLSVARSRERNLEKTREQWRHSKTRKELKRTEGRERPDTCDVCPSSKKICFDHDHTTNKFRGYICSACNTILGLAKDDASLLRKLAEYLEKDNP